MDLELCIMGAVIREHLPTDLNGGDTHEAVFHHRTQAHE